MTRYAFLFDLLGGGRVRLSTTDATDALKVRTANWSTGGGHYFTPWMDPMFTDSFDKLIPNGEKSRVNLVHVTCVTAYTYEENNR